MPRLATAFAAIAPILVLVAAAGPALAQAPTQPPKPDPVRGQALAQRLCTNCHDVSPTESANAKVEPPSFRAIARRPGQTAEILAGKIIIPHPEMPSVAATIPEIRDMVAYILSLKD